MSVRDKVTKKHIAEKHKQAIDMINDVAKVKLGVSEVHGIGVFAIRDIKKGDRVYADAMPNMLDLPYDKFKKLNKEAAEMILERFPMVTQGSHFMVPDTLMQIYMNHSDTPNYDNKTDKALKNIKAGEEIVEDYRAIEGWEVAYPWLIK